MLKTMITFAAMLLPASLPAQGIIPTTTFAKLERLAISGNAEAMYHVGMAYHMGLGVERDYAKALDAFRRSAAAGNPLGAYKLGCYYDGQGGGVLAADPALALRHKLVAAKAGYALAQQDVAAHYGRGGQTDQALVWLERSATQGQPEALLALSRLHQGAPGIAPDPVRSAAYLRLLFAERGTEEERRKLFGAAEAKLTTAQRATVLAQVRNFRIAPTPLTIKANSGQRAAEALVVNPS